ncbi:MAG: DUF3530 family protein [Gammaproteobacteria bacterium]|nr:DUF3530 family protein [Gammaproteobacteria bacterium]
MNMTLSNQPVGLRTILVTFLTCWFIESAASTSTPDFRREARIAEQIEPGIFDGEALWLNANNHDFLSVYLPVDDASGAVILMHGRDVSPEEQRLIGPLRVGLAEQGWSTLAIQMPVLEKGKTYYDYLPIIPYAHGRIEAAIDFLKKEGNDVIILASHSCGAHMANDWLNQNGDAQIAGYVAMGLGATDAGQELETPFPIANMTVPILDIYGSEEYPRPLGMVSERQEMLLKNGHPHSAQIIVEGANHYFSAQGDMMIELVGEWLNGVPLP